MDIFDQAQELERLARETALQRARSSQYWEGPEWIDGQACCRECGEPIPQKRLEALPLKDTHNGINRIGLVLLYFEIKLQLGCTS